MRRPNLPLPSLSFRALLILFRLHKNTVNQFFDGLVGKEFTYWLI
jgi:hypothetical protein